MLRGISFIEDNAENFYSNLPKLMDISLYDWYIDDLDLNYFYFRAGKYSGEEFKYSLEAISTLSFARIRRYPAGSPIGCIDDYEDFAKSACDLLILFYDGGFYELYEKEEKLIFETMAFCQNYGFEKTEYIRDSNDERRQMHY